MPKFFLHFARIIWWRKFLRSKYFGRCLFQRLIWPFEVKKIWPHRSVIYQYRPIPIQLYSLIFHYFHQKFFNLDSSSWKLGGHLPSKCGEVIASSWFGILPRFHPCIRRMWSLWSQQTFHKAECCSDYWFHCHSWTFDYGKD